MTRRLSCLAAAVLLPGLVCPAPAAAQSQDPAAPFLGRLVTEVRIEVEGQPAPADELTALIDVRAGEPLRRVDMRSSIGRLLTPSLARFDDVVVSVAPEGDGVRVVFRLVPRHPVVDLAVSGDTGVPPDELRRLVVARYGGVPTVERLASVEEATRRLLADRGYLDARVEARTTETHVPHQSVLVLDVVAGAVALVGRVEVSGRSPLSPEEVIERVGARPGAPYRRRDVQTRIDAIANELRAQGYYEAVARPVEERGDDGRIALTLVVDAGPLVDLRFTGDPLPPGRIEDLVPIERERSADDDLLEDSRRRIETALRTLGHRDARVQVSRVAEGEGGRDRVAVTFDVARGPRYVVASVVWPDGLAVPVIDLDTAFGVIAGSAYSAAAVDAGLRRVRGVYLQRGYYAVQVLPETTLSPEATPAGEPRVVVRPQIAEGPLGTVTEVAVERDARAIVPEATLRARMRARSGAPFVEADLLLDQRALTQLYLDRGFRTPSVRLDDVRSPDGRDVQVRVRIVEGPQIMVENIVVVGNRRISVPAVLEEVTLRPGAPYGAAQEAESIRRLRELGIFRSVSIIPESLLPGETRASLIVSVEELPAITVGFGGGLEVDRSLRQSSGTLVDRLQFAPRGFFEVTRRNLGGRNRSVSLFSRIALKPRKLEADAESGRRFGFSEYRVALSFREQRAFGTDTSLQVSLASEQAIRTSFNFIRQTINADTLRVIRPGLNWSNRYALDFSRLFDELIEPDDQPLIDRLFPQVRLSILSTGLSWDRRDQPLGPTRGTFATGDVEVALRSIGSEVGYTKTFFQLTGFEQLGAGAGTVLAGRAQVGLARGFQRTVTVEDDDGLPVVGSDGLALTQVVADLPASQRFFAGGSSTVRGFQFDRLGVPEILNADGLSRGGNALIVLNAELRAAVGTLLGRTVSAVGFIDGGNVFARASDLDVTRLRGAYGVGVRYDSPLGPLRFDVGFKMDRQLIRGTRERGWEYHLSLGEIF